MSSRVKQSCRKSTTVKFLITLLIVPSFPKESACYYHEARYYSSSYPGDDGATGDMLRGYTRRIYSATTPVSLSPPTKYSNRSPFPRQRKFSMSTEKVRNVSHQQNHPTQGMITVYQVPAFPPPSPQYLQQPIVPQIMHAHRARPDRTKSKGKPDHSNAAKNSCPGHKNLLDDIGILSLVTAVMSSSFGLYTILVNSMTSNNIGIVSGFMSLLLWVPSTIITLLNLNGDHIYLLGNLLNQLSFVNSMYGFMGVVFGTADVLASAAGESVGIISFILSVIATFPEFLEAIIKYLYRVGGRQTLGYYVENYGCSVPRIFSVFGRPVYNVVNNFLVESIGLKHAT